MINKLLIIFLIAFFIFSCDYGSSFHTKIINNSNKVVILIGFEENKFSVNAHEQYLINTSGLGSYKSVSSSGEWCLCQYGSSFSIIPQDTNYKLIKNLFECANWSKTKKRRFYNRGEFTCTFIIEEQDIVSK